MGAVKTGPGRSAPSLGVTAFTACAIWRGMYGSGPRRQTAPFGSFVAVAGAMTPPSCRRRSGSRVPGPSATTTWGPAA